MSSERGTITIWVLGLCVMVLLLGGLSLDLWRAYADRRALAAAADAAAVAGASAIDVDAYRATNEVRLAPALAESRASASLAGLLDDGALTGARVSADAHRVTVEVQGDVDFTLLGLLTPGDRFEIRVQASAEPRASGPLAMAARAPRPER